MQDRAFLPWISNQDLEQAVLHVYEAMQKAFRDIDLDELQKNVIDPFPLAFETAATHLDTQAWLQAEAQRQAQKSWMNQVGYFHQEVLGSVAGWTNLGSGDMTHVDLMKDDGTVFAEIKNKSNTMNDSGRVETRNRLEHVAQQNPNATVYLVQIIRQRQKPYNEVWTLKDYSPNPRIRKISGELFYAEVTGVETALFDLFHVIPKVMQKIIQTHGKLSLEETSAAKDLESVVSKKTEQGFQDYFFRYAFRNWPALDSDNN